MQKKYIPASVKSAVDMIKDITGSTSELNCALHSVCGVEVAVLSVEGLAGAL